MNEEQNNAGNSQGQSSVPKSETPANVNTLKGIPNLFNKGNKFINDKLKQLTKALAKTIAKSAYAIIASPIGIFIIGGLFFLIVVMNILDDLGLGTVSSSVSSGTSNTFSSWESSGSTLTEQQTLAKSSYEKTGSVMNFSVTDISGMKDQVEESKNNASEGSDIWKVYDGLLTKIGTLLDPSSYLVSPDDNVTIYEHMLLVSKYDFNNVKWKRYGHGYDGEDSPMTIDVELGVTYPSDNNVTTYETFSSLLTPYLLSYEVPQAFYCGLIDNNSNTSDGTIDSDTTINLTHNFIKYGLSDITVNRYDMQKYIEKTYYEDYDYTYYHSSFSVEITKNENSQYVVTFSEVSEVQEGDPQHYNSRLDDDGNVDYLKEYSVSLETPVTSKYYISKAYTFDYKYEYEYRYTKYSEEDAINRINPDSEVPEETALDTPIVGEEYIITDVSNFVYDDTFDPQVTEMMKPFLIILNIEAQYGVTLEKSEDGKYYFKGQTYERRDGSKIYVTRTWSDTLSQTSSSSDYYSVDDLIEFNENTDAGTVSSDEFNADTDSVSYYEELEENQKLNRMDFINSNPNIFNNYISGTPYKTYVGINRNYLEDFCYMNLKQLWQDLQTNHDDVYPYKYGLTYGFGEENNDTSSSSNYLSSYELLRQYIHTHEYAGEMTLYDANYNAVSSDADDSEAVYYKVYSASDGVHTVGYGINIEAQQNKFTELGYDVSAIISQENSDNFNFYIEIEIVDAVEKAVIEEFLNSVKTTTNGLDLKEYQIHALVSHHYPAGNINGFVEAYNEYWNEEEDDIYEKLYDEYKDDAENKNAIMSEIDFDNGVFENFFSFYNKRSLNDKYAGYAERQKSEYTLFSGGYYSTLKKFWSASSGGTIGGFELKNSDGTINQEAVYELQQWYETNILFPEGNVHASMCNTSYHESNDVNLDSSIGSGIYYSKYVTDTYASKITYGFFAYSGVCEPSNNYKPFGINQIGMYQCTWWASCMASTYLNTMNPEKWPNGVSTRGDGGQVAKNLAADYASYGAVLNEDINEIKAHSIASFSNGSGTGHVVYIEEVGVGNDYYVVSHCGSGHVWHGVDMIPKGSTIWYSFNGSVCLDDLL